MRLRLVLALVTVLAGVPAARAEHALIDLRIIHIDSETGQTKDETTASADQEPPAGGHNPRPLARAKVNEPLVLQFFLTNTYPHGDKKDVTVRYVIVREESARQKTLPDLTQGVVMKGTFTMNFKPKCRVGARVAFRISEPGTYLVRVETLNTDSDHEHFSAIDLRVK